jgi:hypothetical protein
VGSDYSPVLQRIKVVLDDVLQKGIDLRHVPIFEDLAFLTDEGWIGAMQGYIVRWADDPRAKE